MDVTTSLKELSQQGHPVAGYKQLLARLFEEPARLSPPSAALRPILDVIVREEVNLLVSRQVLDELCNSVSTLPSEAAQTVLIEGTAAMITRAVSFEEQITRFQEKLAALYEEDEDWRNAARALQRIPLESGHRVIAPTKQLKTYIHIVRLLLADDDANEAELVLNRAALLIHDMGDQEDQLHFKLSQARIMDAKRRFLEASMKYYQLSFETCVEEGERRECLKQAVICAVLSPAGPQRSRILAMLYKSDRTRELVGLYSILTKVYLDRVLSPEDVALFNEHLSEHHHTTLADGSTVLDQAVLQHNVLSISRLYDYIKVSELARLLDVSESRAEAIAARMIGESRIHGSIDQVARLIAFERAPLVEPTRETADPTTGANAGRGNTTLEPSSARVLTRWDERLQTLCAHVEQMVEEIVEKHPDWAKQRASQCV